MFYNEIQIAQQQKLWKAGELQPTWMSSSICLAVCHPTVFLEEATWLPVPKKLIIMYQNAKSFFGPTIVTQKQPL